jgi:single-stranded-DNA-specific exonuclease
MNYKWHIQPPDEALIAESKDLARQLHISDISARLLIRRGIHSVEEAKSYVHPSLGELNDSFLMRDMDKAVERLELALRRNERILIYGDYDVDGTTAVALVYKTLSLVTNNLDFYIPDRYTEGYGISFRGIDYAEEQKCSLIIALDCGIKSIDKVEYATAKGIDFIICDHHTPGETIPAAVAVLNMKRHDCPYPYKELSGCGVGFKFMQAFARRNGLTEQQLKDVLPLLAMSIASDIVPITGENRILAYYGLQQINTNPSIGLRSLMKVAGITDRKLTITDLVFKIGPRINACGRMHSGKEAVQLLLSNNEAEADMIANSVDQSNQERKDQDSLTTDEALELLKADPDNDSKYSTVVYAPHWHKGVVGIAASRLIESYYRPTIVLTRGDDGIISGSARSVAGFDIYSAIDSCRDLLTNFGGHMYAAGLSMRESDLPEFKTRFEKYVSEHITEEQKQPLIPIEEEIAFSDIDKTFFALLRHLEPFGPGNPRPVFLTRNVINNRYTKRVGKMGEHLRLDVTDRTAAITGIAFGKGDFALHMQNGNAVDVCYELDENTFNGVTSIQMMVQDIKTVKSEE